MAWSEKLPNGNYRVKWREAGKIHSRRFTDKDEADTFREIPAKAMVAWLEYLPDDKCRATWRVDGQQHSRDFDSDEAGWQFLDSLERRGQD